MPSDAGAGSRRAGPLRGPNSGVGPPCGPARRLGFAALAAAPVRALGRLRRPQTRASKGGMMVDRSGLRRLLWFVGLWAAGVATVGVVAALLRAVIVGGG
jgi:hypothetical protein